MVNDTDTPCSENPSGEPIQTLTISPIGYIHTEMTSKFETPRQPDGHSGSQAVIELLPNHNFHMALEDLAGFERVWIVFWFHRNTSWRPKVRPPRGAGEKRGLFATRSPHRPNPIGISAVSLLEISGCKVVVGACDLIDGTPILDIKPYIPSVDSFPEARIGWLQEIEDAFSVPPSYLVTMSERATGQVALLDSLGITFIERASAMLARDPSPNRTRRIKQMAENKFRICCADWRIFYSVVGQEVVIENIEVGYLGLRKK